MVPQRVATLLQVIGAALGIPAAAAGTYTAYQTYFSADATCQRLRTNILAVMERHIATDAKQALLRKDISQFDKDCGDSDPDARAIFQAVMQDFRPPANVDGRTPRPAANAEPAAPVVHRQPLAVFGTSGPGDAHGWVAISRKNKSAGTWAVNFAGYAISEVSLPPAGTILTAQRPVPVWSELQGGTANDQSKLQSRVPVGACVRVLATRAGSVRLWAEVAPAKCS